MCGATDAFGQPSTQSMDRQDNSASNIPVDSASPLGSQTATAMFGGTPTGVSDVAQSASPLVSSMFGYSFSPAPGSSFPAFGNSSSSGGKLLKPAFGGFESTPTQSSPFGSTLQQSLPVSGSNVFASSTTPFGSSNQPAFGDTDTAFGSTNTLAFGEPSSCALGATATNAFGATSAPSLSDTCGTFGVALAAFGSKEAFGASGTSPFCCASSPAFGTSTSASSSPTLRFRSTPAFNSSPFRTTRSAFGAQTSAFGVQSTTPAFGNACFSQKRGGSRISPYTPTTDPNGDGTNSAKLDSISSMPIYKEKTHEELRWEDHQLGDKGGPNPGGPNPPNQSTNGIGFGPFTAQTNAFTSLPSLFSFTPLTSSNPLAPSTTEATSTPTFITSPFAGPPPSNSFGQFSLSAPSLFATSTPAFVSNPSPSIIGTSSSSDFGSSPSLFRPTPAQGSTPVFRLSNGFSIGGTQSSPMTNSTTPPSVHAGFNWSHWRGLTTSYTPTNDVDGASCTRCAGKLESISAMPVFKEKSPEKLRGLDYMLGDKGTRPTTPAFGNAGFGPPRWGSEIAPYAPTTEVDGFYSTQPAVKLVSISAMPAYKEKSHEELRWEDYQLGNKGQPSPSLSSKQLFYTGGTQPSPLFQSTAPSFRQTSLFAQPMLSGFGQPTSFVFGQPTSFIFGQPTTFVFGQAMFYGFGQIPTPQSNIFSSPSTGFGQNPTRQSNIFSPPSATGLGQPTFSSFRQNPTSQSNLFNAPSTGFGQPTFSSFGQNPTPQSNHFSPPPSTGFSFVQNPTPSAYPSSTPSTGVGHNLIFLMGQLSFV